MVNLFPGNYSPYVITMLKKSINAGSAPEIKIAYFPGLKKERTCSITGLES